MRRYEERMPGTARARNHDPHFNYQTTWLRHMLSLADVVMEDGGVPVEVRERVVRCLLYGSPNPAEAELRMEQQELLTEALKMQPPPTIVMPMPEGWRP